MYCVLIYVSCPEWLLDSNDIYSDSCICFKCCYIMYGMYPNHDGTSYSTVPVIPLVSYVQGHKGIETLSNFTVGNGIVCPVFTKIVLKQKSCLSPAHIFEQSLE